MRLALTITGAILATAMLALATPASAQSGAPPTAQQASGGAIGRMSSDDQLRRREGDEYRAGVEAQQMTVEEAEAQYGADRVALAERVQALMDAGQCTEARRVASEAGERAMALRVRQTCRRR
ncbi:MULTISPECIES: hypothetical protein [Brevundimonas]|jgi:hypothetical protein|uniref:DUF4148 domain-containing protein n=1 Tax=Brevundimonas halotolerans TaxID=69670 RepID=A0A7W9E6K6_9CAUL|nr:MULTISPECIES: hypothetical protein [Brevundimonas]MAL89011.1 hypothetical protein [Brevundimonas sp.]MBB5659961.1 hypothetical protein [Brevundimonas halotolerans]|tara:strand:- start:16805 stop:17173 length:369 start_codon:yes stop_codon:yes gene_type:complete